MTRTAGESWEMPQSPDGVRKIGRDQYRASRYFMVWQTTPDVAYDRAEPQLPQVGSPFPTNFSSGRGISARGAIVKSHNLQMRYYDAIGTPDNEHTIIVAHYETGPDWSETTNKRRILWEASGASETVTLTHQPLGPNIGKRLAHPITITQPLVAVRAIAEGPSNTVGKLALRHIGKVNSDTIMGYLPESLLLDAVDIQLVAGSNVLSGGALTVSRAVLTFLWRPGPWGWRETEPQLDPDTGDQRNNGETLFVNDFMVRETHDFRSLFAGWIVGDPSIDNV